jgi:glycosyltransferase involved in cell wall biosynthesis
MPEQTETPQQQSSPEPSSPPQQDTPEQKNQNAAGQSGGEARGRQQGQERRGRPQHQQRRQQQQPHQQQSGGVEVSVVVPLLNEADSLKELHQQLRTALSRLNTRYELLFVDDGSTDKSYQVLRDLKRVDNRVKIIRLRRNYGKSAALSVGFEKALGNIIITMDADLQDDPAEIPSLVRRLNEGYDLVSGWKKTRRDPLTKTIPSRFFNFVTGLMTGIKIHDFNCGFKVYRKEVVKTVKVYGELHRYIPVLAHWEGFRVGELIVNHRPRKFGKTKFGLGRFWKGFLDLLTVLFTTRYLRRPLHLFGFWGMMFVLAGVVIDGWLVVEWFLGLTALSNRPLFLGGILLIIVGIQMISIGLLGEMITRTRQSEEQYSIREFIR